MESGPPLTPRTMVDAAGTPSCANPRSTRARRESRGGALVAEGGFALDVSMRPPATSPRTSLTPRAWLPSDHRMSDAMSCSSIFLGPHGIAVLHFGHVGREPEHDDPVDGLTVLMMRCSRSRRSCGASTSEMSARARRTKGPPAYLVIWSAECETHSGRRHDLCTACACRPS